MVHDTRDRNDNSVKWGSRFDFVDAQIAMVRGRMVELKAEYGETRSYKTFVSMAKEKEHIHNLLILRLGMSVGTDTTVESAVTQVLNWKDGER